MKIKTQIKAGHMKSRFITSMVTGLLLMSLVPVPHARAAANNEAVTDDNGNAPAQNDAWETMPVSPLHAQVIPLPIPFPFSGPILIFDRVDTNILYTTHSPNDYGPSGTHRDRQTAELMRTAFFDDSCQQIANCGLNGPDLNGTRLQVKSEGNDEHQTPASASKGLVFDNVSRTFFFDDSCQEVVNCGLNGPDLNGTRVKVQDLKHEGNCPPWMCDQLDLDKL